MHKPTFYGLVLGLTSVAGVAAAQYPPPAPAPGYGYPPPAPVAPPRLKFGDAGDFVISNDLNASFVGNSRSDNGGSDWSLNLHPAADYFVIQGLSVGGFVDYTHGSTSSTDSLGNATTTSTNSFGVGPRVGYNIPFADALSFWPKLSFGFTYFSVSGGTSGPSTLSGASGGSGNKLSIRVDAPVLYHPVSHFFLGLGPMLSTDLSSSFTPDGGSSGSSTKTTSYGVVFTMGGWFGFM